MVAAQVRFSLLESVRFAEGRGEVRFLAVGGGLSREHSLLNQEVRYIRIEQVVHVGFRRNQFVDVPDNPGNGDGIVEKAVMRDGFGIQREFLSILLGLLLLLGLALGLRIAYRGDLLMVQLLL